MNQAFHRYIL